MLPSGALVHVVDDDDAVRRSLSLLLRSAGYTVRSHASAEAFLAGLDNAAPDPRPTACAILDVRMSGMDGLMLQAKLMERPGPRIPVIIVTGHADVPLAVRAMRAGAVDFIEKPYLPGRMLSAVADAQKARRPPESPLDPAMTAKLALLTGREREVLAALVEGKSNKAVAIALSISPRTVEAHRASLMERLAAGSLAEAIRIALGGGLVPR